MMKSSTSAIHTAIAQQETRLKETWYGKVVPNDYEEYRKLIDPRPEEIANSARLYFLGRIVTVL